jgi:hypothetical protein
MGRKVVSDICLSIDWDFFTPGAVHMWDEREIDETLYYLWNRWRERSQMQLIDRIKAVNAEGFWRWLAKWFVLTPRRQVVISESHVAMSKLLTEKHKTLVLFDSHHDCYSLNKYREKKEILDCGNWGTYWLRKYNGKSHMIWVSQLSKRNRITYAGSIDRSIRNSVRAYLLRDVEQVFDTMCKKAGDRIRLDFIHMCRSGCWAPPWTDRDFLAFLKRSKFDCQVIKYTNNSGWNPMLDRWKDRAMQHDYNRNKGLLEVLQVPC